MKKDIIRLHPTARTIAVTSGKGGAGKTTTAVALAKRLTDNGHRVLLVDVDVPAPNVAIVADVSGVYKARQDAHQIVPPTSPYGFRVCSPTFFRQAAGFDDMFDLPLWVNEVDVIVYDLAGGWTKAQERCVERFVDVFVLCTPPTAPALADHAAQARHLASTYIANVRSITDSNKARKHWGFPPLRLVAVETLASAIGTLPNGEVAEVRRLDAVPADDVPAAIAVQAGDDTTVEFVGTIPPAVDVTALAATDPVGRLADLCMGEAV